jgi:SulP family sulfate permease
VTVGFTAGIAVIILISQLRDLLGLTLTNDPADTLPKLRVIWPALSTFNPVTVLLSAVAIGIILGVRKLRPNWPSLLISVAGVTVLAALLGLDVETIGSRFGAIQSGLPAPSLPSFSLEKIRAVLPDAFAIAILGAIESLLSAVDGGIVPTANWSRKASATSRPQPAAACR